MVSAGCFVPRESVPPLTDALQDEGTVFPSCILCDPQITQFAPGLLACLLSRSRAEPLSRFPSQGHESPKLHSLSPTGCKTQKLETLPLSFSQAMALGKCSPCAFPCASHSFAFPCNQGSFPSAAPEISFFPKQCLHTFYLP